MSDGRLAAGGSRETLTLGAAAPAALHRHGVFALDEMHGSDENPTTRLVAGG